MEKELIPMPTPSNFLCHVIEVANCGRIGNGLIVAKTISLNHDMAVLTDAKIKCELESEDSNPWLGVGMSNYHGSGRCVKVACYEIHPVLVIPGKSVTIVYSISNFDDFPVTREWALTSRAEAEVLLVKKLAEKNAGIAAENKKIYPLVVRDYKNNHTVYILVGLWQDMGLLQKLRYGFSRNKFDAKHYQWHFDRIDLEPLNKMLDNAGVEYK